jgi:hypothetical protein
LIDVDHQQSQRLVLARRLRPHAIGMLIEGAGLEMPVNPSRRAVSINSAHTMRYQR